MRIGIDARLWNETGVGRYIRALVSELEKLDTSHEYVLFLRKDMFGQYKPTKPNWQTVLADVHWHSMAEQLYMPNLYKKAGVDLVHIPYFSVPILTPRPFVVTIHDLTISHKATGQATTKPLPVYLLKRAAYHMTINQAVKSACQLITVSHVVKKQLIKEFKIPEERVSVTYEAGELEETRNQAVIHPPKPYILYVGNAHPHKNLKNLVLAFSYLLKRHPKLHLVLIGKKDFFYEKLKGFIHDNELGDHILMPGEVKNGELVSWYKQAESFIFPSSSEGFGIPGLEAMSVGCPVIASDIPVFREIYRDGAAYFNYEQPEEIAKVVSGVLSDSAGKKKMVSNGKHIATSYSWKKMAQDTLTIYENCTRL